MEEIDSFFESAPRLQNENAIQESVDKFINHHCELKNRVVCITSGGTTVPLERRCVRFIDNFSSGTRGAASTEYFLKAGYAVIFLYRRESVQPFCRFLPENALFSCFEPNGCTGIKVKAEHQQVVEDAVRAHYEATGQCKLLKVEFTTLFQYLQILRIIAKSMHLLQKCAMFYLAAAVSDFYVPWNTMGEHKIQSSEGPLAMQLASVPKMLYAIREHWAPSAFCVSFKLETDLDILIRKAKDALQKYGVHAVVANELLTRRNKVIVVMPKEDRIIEKDSSHLDVETLLVDFLEDRHANYIVADQRH